jgi:hypothetical protein
VRRERLGPPIGRRYARRGIIALSRVPDVASGSADSVLATLPGSALAAGFRLRDGAFLARDREVRMRLEAALRKLEERSP